MAALMPKPASRIAARPRGPPRCPSRAGCRARGRSARARARGRSRRGRARAGRLEQLLPGLVAFEHDDLQGSAPWRPEPSGGPWSGGRRVGAPGAPGLRRAGRNVPPTGRTLVRHHHRRARRSAATRSTARSTSRAAHARAAASSAPSPPAARSSPAGSLIGGLPGVALGKSAQQDGEILNFALLLEYLESEFYVRAVERRAHRRAARVRHHGARPRARARGGAAGRARQRGDRQADVRLRRHDHRPGAVRRDRNRARGHGCGRLQRPGLEPAPADAAGRRGDRVRRGSPRGLDPAPRPARATTPRHSSYPAPTSSTAR